MCVLCVCVCVCVCVCDKHESSMTPQATQGVECVVPCGEGLGLGVGPVCV